MSTEERPGNRTRAVDDHGERNGNAPAVPPRRCDGNRLRCGRRLRRRHERLPRRLRNRDGSRRRLDRVGKQPPRLLGEHGVDQRELGADRSECGQVLDVVRARVHGLSLTVIPAGTPVLAGPKNPLFARKMALCAIGPKGDSRFVR
jgi:hypothetical protein